MKFIFLANLALSLLFMSCAHGPKNETDEQAPDEQSYGEIKTGGPSNHKIKNFRDAKKIIAEIQTEHPYTIYCNCRYEEKKIDLESCGYKIINDEKRARRLEWEHVVPAENFGQSFMEWRKGGPMCTKRGRKCAETNPEFSRIEADLYNLWPEVGELNGLRSNYSMAQLTGSEFNFGGCKAKIQDKKFEPMDFAKGIVARVFMYMEQAYPGRGIISHKNKKLYEAWDKLFPVNEWECKRAQLIKDIQGNANPILEERCNKKL